MTPEVAVDAEIQMSDGMGRGGRVGVRAGSCRGSRLGSGFHAPSLEIVPTFTAQISLAVRGTRRLGESSLAAGQGRQEQGSWRASMPGLIKRIWIFPLHSPTCTVSGPHNLREWSEFLNLRA